MYNECNSIFNDNKTRLNELQDELELVNKKYNILHKVFTESNDKYLKLNEEFKSENNKHDHWIII